MQYLSPQQASRFLSRILATLMLAAIFSAAHADSGRGYISPMAGWFIADDNRLADDGVGGAIAIGVETSTLFNIELELGGDTMDRDAAAGGVQNFQQFSAAVNGLLVLTRDSLFSPYLLVGAGILNTTASTDKGASAMGQIGLGTFINMSDNLALRVDGRYRLDTNDGNYYSQSKFEDYVVMFGVAWKFGDKAAPVVVATPPVAAVAAVVAPQDSDRDGITDNFDKCPNTPSGVTVDADGCEIKTKTVGDADGDGISDDKDLCPNTPADTKVNATGCPEKQALVLEGVNFATNSDKLTPASGAILDKVAAALVANTGVNVHVDGHTDNIGSAEVNQALSKRRAESVKGYLVSNGVDAERISARGFGSDNPIANNKTAAGRAQNRRVELSPIE